MEPQIQAFLDEIASQQNLSLNTRLSYANDLRCFTSFLRDSLRRSPQLVDFNAQHIINFLDFERRRGRRRSTIQRRRATLRRFANFLGIGFQLPELPLEPGQENPFPPIETLSTVEINQIFAVFKAQKSPLGYRDWAIFATMLVTGLSVSQLIQIKTSAITLDIQKLQIPLRNGKKIEISLGTAAEPLRNYLQSGRPEINGAGQHVTLFISQKGRQMTRQGIWQVLRKWGQAAQISGQLSPRRIRNTAAKQLLAAGHPQAFHLDGGLFAWKEAGLSTVS